MTIEIGTKGSDRTDAFRDALFTELKNLRRRYALFYLNRIEGSATLDELAEQIAAWENNLAPEDVTTAQHRSVYNALHQTHLPKLERLGVVIYDSEAKTIQLTDRARKFDLYLATDTVRRALWHKYYMLIVGLGFAAVALKGFRVPPFDSLSDLSLTAGILGAILFVSVLHYTAYVRWCRRAEENIPDVILEFNE